LAEIFLAHLLRVKLLKWETWINTFIAFLEIQCRVCSIFFLAQSFVKPFIWDVIVQRQ
jgi:hypothetical protein